MYLVHLADMSQFERLPSRKWRQADKEQTSQTETVLSKIDCQQDEAFNVSSEGCNYHQRKPQRIFFANERAISFQFVDPQTHFNVAGVNITQCSVKMGHC